MKKRKRIKRTTYYFYTLCLILFLLILFFIFFEKSNDKINKYAHENIQKEIYNEIHKTVKKSQKLKVLENLYKVYFNKNEEIIYIDYNLPESYIIIDEFVEEMQANFQDIILDVPILIASNNIFLINLGPKVRVKVSYVDSLFASIFTKVTEYGINNALLEIYIKVEINGKLITTFQNDDVHLEYDMLIGARVINGKVPNIITSNIPIN